MRGAVEICLLALLIMAVLASMGMQIALLACFNLARATLWTCSRRLLWSNFKLRGRGL